MKEAVYDENGDQLFLFEYDPAQTIWQAGHQNHLLSATYFDLLSGTSWPYTYEYENCGPAVPQHIVDRAHRPSVPSIGYLNLSTLLTRSAGKPLKLQVAEWRRQLKNTKPDILKQRLPARLTSKVENINDPHP